MKYVMFQRRLGEGMVQNLPVIFPNQLVHAEVAAAIMAQPGMADLKPISAGEMIAGCYGCSGHSSTLGLDSRGDEDEAIIRSIDYLHGIEET